jgi:hypothetical protein
VHLYAVLLPESFRLAIVAQILEEEKAKKDLQSAEDLARVAAAFNGVRCTIADCVVDAHSRAVAAATSADEHAQLLAELNAALSAVGSFLDAQQEPVNQSARWVRPHRSQHSMSGIGTLISRRSFGMRAPRTLLILNFSFQNLCLALSPDLGCPFHSRVFLKLLRNHAQDRSGWPLRLHQRL